MPGRFGVLPGELVPGGCDECDHAVFERATRAVDKFMAAGTPRLFYSVPVASAYIIEWGNQQWRCREAVLCANRTATTRAW
jgi:hypothetical protein